MTTRALAIDADWLWDRLHELGRIGAIAGGGVNRQAFTPEEDEAIGLLIGWAKDLNCAVSADAIGNIFLSRPGLRSGPPLVVGSHIDTQPKAGRYDGCYGVISGLATMESLERTGTRLQRELDVVVWRNEEGCRFSPGTMGSAWFTGQLELDDLDGVVDPAGIALKDELARSKLFLESLGVSRRDRGPPIHAFIEAHIEQGPILEAAGCSVGVVDGIHGAFWYLANVNGRSAHAGTTPRAKRQDAFAGACAFASALRGKCDDPQDQTRFTIGRCEVHPGAINTVPDHVSFTIDLRHPDLVTLKRLDGEFDRLAQDQWEACSVGLQRTMRLEPVAFEPALVTALQSAAEDQLGKPALMMRSGAFHDAANLARCCPTAMLFIPCAGGVSHHPSEAIGKADAAAGASVLAAAIQKLSEGEVETQS